MRNNERNKVLLTIILVLVVAFYWFAIRPSNIKKECSVVPKETSEAQIDQARAYIKENCKSTGEQSIECLTKRAFLGKAMKEGGPASNSEYEQCLRSKGL
jgi:hypothetical protein